MNEIIRTPAMIAGEINLIKEQVRSTALHASIEIGRRLQEAKALVPVGDWYMCQTQQPGRRPLCLCQGLRRVFCPGRRWR